MGFTGFSMAIVAGFFTLIAPIPFLDWLNWFIAPFAFIALILSLVGVVRGNGRVFGVIGLIICAVVLPVSLFRLITGSGVI